MPSPLRLFTLLILLCPPLLATPRVHDFGHGLTYIRIQAIPDDLPSAENTPSAKAWIVDLRGAKTDQSQTRTLLAWLRARPAKDRPALVLLNNDTSQFLSERVINGKIASLITLAPAGSAIEPDIIVETTISADKVAEVALRDEETFGTLVTPSPDKVRWDEATLDKDIKEGGAGLAPEPVETTQALDEKKVETYKPRDLVLARAIQIHRGLLALNTGRKTMQR